MKDRKIYIDNLRVYLTILVVLHHAAVTFGAPGSWYYNEPPDGLASGLLLTVFVATNQSFFMGLFFFLSSYFLVPSYQRKGASRFMTDRVKRLGIPIVFYSLVISPLTIYAVIAIHKHANISFVDYYLHRDNWISLGVLWFTAALLIFSAVFLLVDRIRPQQVQTSNASPLPSDKKIFYFACILGVVSFFVRIVFPIGWTLQPLGFQLAHFPQYIALFAIGITAQRNQWLQSLTPQRGRRWGWMAIGLGVIGFPLIYGLKIITHTELDAFMGGFTVQSFANAMWEQLMGVSLVVAVLTSGKQRLNRQGARMQAMSRAAYAVYIIHPLVLVLVSLLLKDVYIPTLLKFLTVGVIAVLTSFGVGFVLTRLPVVKDIV